jgi:hypothetical protein
MCSNKQSIFSSYKALSGLTQLCVVDLGFEHSVVQLKAQILEYLKVSVF